MKQLFPFIFLLILCTSSCTSTKKQYNESIGKKYICTFEGDKYDIDSFLDKRSIHKQDSVRLLYLGWYSFYSKKYKHLISYFYLEDEQVFTKNSMGLSSLDDWCRSCQVVIRESIDSLNIRIFKPKNDKKNVLNGDIILKCTKESEVTVEEFRNKKSKN